MRLAECSPGSFQIRHRVHINPGLRHGDDHICTTKAESFQHMEILWPRRREVLQQIFTRHARMDTAIDQPLCDLARGEKPHIDFAQSRDFRLVAALATNLAHFKSTGFQPLLGFLLQPSLGGDRK